MKQPYMPQLDTLRFFAALGVVNLHWCNGYWSTELDWSFGVYGIPFFFVLSGFLITRVLLGAKDETANRLGTIGSFFFRRALRLFPIYYLFVLYLLLVRDDFVRTNIAFFLTYTPNIGFFTRGGLVDLWSNHLWSLGIEEQFYLLFPWLILFVAKRFEVGVSLGMVSVGLLSQFLAAIGAVGDRPIFLLPTTQLDTLGAGVLLGILVHRGRLDPIRRVCPSPWWVGMWFLLALLCHSSATGRIRVFLLAPVLLLFFTSLVYVASNGFPGLAGRILDFNWFRYLGKTSYGIYLYHKVIPLSLVILLNKAGIVLSGFYLTYAVNFAILIAVSSLSWWLIELPIQNGKKYFPYSRPKEN